jgi:Ala-tRNA(Pro) deacylase
MSLPALEQYLREFRVPFSTLSHGAAYRATEVAARAGVPCRQMAKPVLVDIDGALAMAVVPADARVDLARLREVTDAGSVRLAGEAEFQDRFPECEPGAMPPFGNLYGMALYVDRQLADDGSVCFNAGSHTDLLRMRYADFERLANPCVADIAAAGPKGPKLA